MNYQYSFRTNWHKDALPAINLHGIALNDMTAAIKLIYGY